MRTAAKFAFGTLLSLPGILIIVLGLGPLRDGLAVDGAIPVPMYMIQQAPLSKSAYQRAARALGAANASNGQAAIFAAEAKMRAGDAPVAQIPELNRALTNSPADARGWMILSDAYATVDPKRAASALGQSLLLAPYDYFLAEPRAARAASLWAHMDSDTRDMAARQTLLLWESPDLQPTVRILLRTPTGVDLVKRSFKHHQTELRDMNRWLFIQRQRDATRAQQ